MDEMKNNKKIDDEFHQWSEYIYSINLREISEETKRLFNLSDKELWLASSAMYCRINGGILINESYPYWESARDLFLALDRLPHSLVKDIYKYESIRYAGVKDSLDGVSDPEEKVRRLLHFSMMPDLLWAYHCQK